jgi:copper resistance protein D
MESMMPSLALIVARIVHFASTAQIAGIFIFLLFVESPVLGELCGGTLPMVAAFRKRLLRIAWFGMAISIASGAAWLLILVAKITGSSVTSGISDGTALTLLTHTQFGHAWEARLLLAAVLAGLNLHLGQKTQWRWADRFGAAALAMGFLGALAWAGHGGATPGMLGDFHVAGDTVHLIAAGAWLGGLLPLGILLSAAGEMPGAVGATITYRAAQRFSTLGILAVATLILTGIFNAWILVGSVESLVDSTYGVLLLVKITIFLAMLTVAAFNRMRWTRRLATHSEFHTWADALRRLKRNCLIEIALGLAIIIDVGVLGTIYHGMHG